MKITTRINELFGIEYPIVQGGMVWVSGWKLAAAVSNCGGLGLIGAGSMKPELLSELIRKCKSATEKPFGVNLPMLRKDSDDLVKTIIDEGVKIVFTSAGHPGKYIQQFKEHGIKVAHVVSNLKQAKKAESVGCDAIVVEGVEAGGHNGPDELTTLALLQIAADEISTPLIGAGGIATGRGMLAVLALGAEGVQIGTLFAATVESSAHENFKNALVKAQERDTVLILRKLAFARVIKNSFSDEVIKKEFAGVGEETLKNILGDKREKIGIFDGDLDNGMLEAGEGVALIKDILTVKEVFDNLISEYEAGIKKLNKISS